MIDERRESQASLYVLGALPADEVREFEQTLRTDLELQLLVTELRTVSDAMVVAFPQVAPPPGLKQSILRAITPSGVAPATVVAPADGFTRGLQNWLPWAIAACFAVLCVLLLSLGHSFRQEATDYARALEARSQEFAELQRENDALLNRLDQNATNYTRQAADLRKDFIQKAEEFQKQKTELQRQVDQRGAEVVEAQRRADVLRRQVQQTAEEVQRLNEQLANTPNVDRFNQLNIRVLSATQDGPARAIGASVWDVAEQKGLLVVENLSPLPTAQDYQLWLFDPKYAGPVSGGVFVVDERGNARFQFRTGVLVETAERFAISVERKGGVQAPQGKVVLLSN